MTLEAVEINKAFGGVVALSNVSITVDSGEVVGVIGPNGSGKTTLLNILSGVFKPSRGAVKLDGAVVSGKPPEKLARLGVARTFQNIRLFQEMTVRENLRVAEAARPRREKATRISAAEAMADVGITQHAERLAGQLPYGLQRRTEIARALALEPSFLLLDEPAAGLNDAESDDLLRVLLEIRQKYDVGVLVIDHDLRLMMRLSERLVVLNEGHMIAAGHPDAIRNDPAVIKAYLG